MEQIQHHDVQKKSDIIFMNRSYIYSIYFLLILLVAASCSPKSVITDPEELSELSRSWIPFLGNESVVYEFDGKNMIFDGTLKQSYFETVLYKTDQSGFFTFQEDYYADLERQVLEFNLPNSPYFFKYYLEKNKTQTSDWDILKVTMADGDYYKNEIKIAVLNRDDFDKGEHFQFKASVTLAGKTFENVYYWTQERRPYELYYTQELGIVAYKVATNELWTIKPD